MEPIRINKDRAVFIDPTAILNRLSVAIVHAPMLDITSVAAILQSCIATTAITTAPEPQPELDRLTRAVRELADAIDALSAQTRDAVDKTLAKKYGSIAVPMSQLHLQCEYVWVTHNIAERELNRIWPKKIRRRGHPSNHFALQQLVSDLVRLCRSANLEVRRTGKGESGDKPRGAAQRFILSVVFDVLGGISFGENDDARPWLPTRRGLLDMIAAADKALATESRTIPSC